MPGELPRKWIFKDRLFILEDAILLRVSDKRMIDREVQP